MMVRDCIAMPASCAPARMVALYATPSCFRKASLQSPCHGLALSNRIGIPEQAMNRGMAQGDTELLGLTELARSRLAILAIDVVDSVRTMQLAEDEVIAIWRSFVKWARDQILPRFGGRMVKSLGDGMLLTFDNARQALACATEMHREIAALNHRAAGGVALELRAGLHCAEIVVDDVDVYGTSVNLVCRLTSLADPGGIVATIEVVDQIIPGLHAEVEDLGECFVKGLADPVRAYRLSAAGASSSIRSGDGTGPQPPEREHPRLPRPRLAVLTLEGSSESNTLRSLVSDELATGLAAHSTIDALSRMSTRHVQGADAADLLARLKAHYAVGGSCRAEGGRVTLFLELVYVADQSVVWSQARVLSIHDVVARPADVFRDDCNAIMAAIEAHETGKVRSLPLASLESYALLLGGVRLMHRLSRGDFDRARAVLEALVARHPRHPDGYAWLAKWHILQLHQGWSTNPQTSASMARDMARRALDHDDQCGVAMVVSGMVKTYNDRDLTAAAATYERALAHHPNDALAWLLKGTLHAFRGEGDLAVMHTRRARELSPLDPMAYYYDSLSASAEAAAGHYEEAVDLALRSLRANSMHASTLRILAISYAMLDRLDEARQVTPKMLALEPDFNVGRFLARSPSADYAVGKTFANALLRAGVPA